MTYYDVAEKLKAAGIENFDGEARLLIEHFCNVKTTSDADFDDAELASAIEKRLSGYPLQYILGKWWLARCEFFVDENCLIPRPDTECVIEQAVKLLPKDARFADLCTGSGCIAISILDLRTDTRADAYELYPKTLEIAKKNAVHNGVSDRFRAILGDVTNPYLLGEEKYAAIVSNPPYIKRDVVPTLSREVGYEPAVALDGGIDGLDFYRAIVKNFARNLDEGGAFIFEIGYDQARDLEKIARDGGFSCRIVRDLGGNDRVAVLTREK